MAGTSEPEKPWAELHVISDDPALKEHRMTVCSRVRAFFEAHFRIESHPRVICIFDDQDHMYLKQEPGGEANRGVHWPIRGQGISDWPWYTHDIIAQPDYTTGNVVWPYASVIYLHGSTCESDIGLTLTFAHELQHFLQYVQEKPLWALNILLINLRNEEFKVWWDFPVEIQARVTVKRVAEMLYGKKAVREFILCRIEAHITDIDAEDWKYVQGIDSSVDYSLAEETKSLVRRFREQLESELQRRGNDPDFVGLNVDAFC